MATPFAAGITGPLTSGPIQSTGTPGSGVGQLNVGPDVLAQRAAANARPPIGPGFEVPLQEPQQALPVEPQQQLEQPPASEEERQVRKGAWIDLLNQAIADPDASQALLFLGAQ